MRVGWLIVVWLTVLGRGGGVTGTRIDISPEGGYSEVTVAIDQEVDEDEDIINRIKELITEASESLHVATKGAVFFEDVIIALPSSWSDKKEYSSSLKNNVKDADVVVAQSDYSDEPLTIQPGGCGEPGLSIHLTPNYLRNMKEPTNVDKNGIPGKRFVQEWAKFRYGIFEEFVTEELERKDHRFQRYYDDLGEKLPSTCTANIGNNAFYVDKKNQPCDPKIETKNCRYVIFNNYVNEEASLMYSSSYDTVNTFCDEHNHNRRAPNKQNFVCNYQSTWKVITSHDDFKVAQVPKVFKARNTVPSFRFVRTLKDSGKTVLILDISGSMGFFNGAPIKLLHQTATSHILEFVPDGSHLGIVVFGTNAKVVHPLVKVDNTTRKSLAGAIPTKADGGGTAIGKGLITGLQVLKQSGVVEGGVLLLITDGEENESPRIADVTETLLQERVVISVIAYGEKADKQLESLALETEGRASFFREINNTEAQTQKLNDMLVEASSAQADVKFEPVKLRSSGFVLHTQETEDKVFLDHELGKNTVFYFSWTYKASPEIELVSPSGTKYNWQSEGIYYTKDNNRIRFKFADAETGHWTIIIRKRQNENPDIQFTLTSEPQNSKRQPVRVHSWTSNVEIDPQNQINTVRIYSRVTKNERPVLGASVVAVVAGRQSSKKIPLADDGKGADISKDDGTYTGLITINEFQGNGRYTIRARVTGRSKASLKLRRKYKARGNKRPKRSDLGFDANELEIAPEENANSEEVPKEDDHDIDEEIATSAEASNVDEDYDYVIEEEVNLGEFERDSEAGTIIVSNWVPNIKDTTAPDRVSDLEVVNVSWVGNDKHVTLSWSESGDDLSKGNASALEVRFSLNFESLLNYFDTQLQLEDSDVFEGNLKPGVGEELKVVTFRIPEDFLSVQSLAEGGSLDETPTLANQSYIAVRYSDEEKNTGSISNIAIVSFLKPKDICQKVGNDKCGKINAICNPNEENQYTCNCSAGLVFNVDGTCTDVCNAMGSEVCAKLKSNCLLRHDDNSSFTCNCSDGYYPNQEGLCLDICELKGKGDCEDLNADCLLNDLDNSTYRCVCPQHLSNDINGVCRDICATAGKKECSKVKADCVIDKTNGSSYVCECPFSLTFNSEGVCSNACEIEGYEICSRRKANCALQVINNATYVCQCSTELSFDQAGICVDICQSSGNRDCAQSNALCVLDEVNNATYACECPRGLYFDSERKCSDQCKISGNDFCAEVNALCEIDKAVNTTFICECASGLQFDTSSRPVCVDVCEFKGLKECSKVKALCFVDEFDNTSYRCECPEGLAFDSNSVCADICQMKGNQECLVTNAVCVIDETDKFSYFCECPIGLFCDSNSTCVDICEKKGNDDCAPNNALCVIDESDNTTYNCECSAGLSFDQHSVCSDICEIKGNEQCLDLNAICFLDGSDESLYFCQCSTGLFANSNSVCVDICSFSGNEDCHRKNSNCVIEESDNSTYRCECPAGLTFDNGGVCADICQIKGNEGCLALNAVCYVDETDNSKYFCKCPTGLFENFKSSICVDICRYTGDEDCSLRNADCVVDELDNSTYNCECPYGLFPDDERFCVDKCKVSGYDECSKLNAHCLVNETNPSIYSCQCAEGLIPDSNSKCDHVCNIVGSEECSLRNAHCVKNVSNDSSYYCKCAPSLSFDSNGNCSDICVIKGQTECDLKNAICLLDTDVSYNCTCDENMCQTSAVVNTSYHCECPKGLSFDSDGKCADACHTFGNNLCSQSGSICVLDHRDNSSYHCECPSGLVLHEGSCKDVCIAKGEAICEASNALCVVDSDNTLNFSCRCPSHMKKNKDGVCSDICQTKGSGKCSMLNAACILNEDDSTKYECVCPSNLMANTNGLCLDACKLRGDTDCLSRNGKCVLNGRNYTCECPNGLTPDTKGMCGDVCEIKGNQICAKKNATCQVNYFDSTSFSCRCNGQSAPGKNGKCTNKDVDVRIVDRKQTLTQGRNVIFRCRDEGKRRLNVSWIRKDGRPLPALSSVYMGTLVIRNVQPGDSGVYYCFTPSVYPSTKGSRKRANLKVRPAQCASFQFQCHNGQCLDINKRCDRRHDCDDSTDEYNCVYSQDTSSGAFKFARMMVSTNEVDTEDPKIVIHDSNQTMVESRTAVFRCRDEGPKRLPVEWIRADGWPLPSGANVERGRLLITNLQVRDTGLYVCKPVGSDSGTEHSKSVYLRVDRCHGLSCSFVFRNRKH